MMNKEEVQLKTLVPSEPDRGRLIRPNAANGQGSEICTTSTSTPSLCGDRARVNENLPDLPAFFEILHSWPGPRDFRRFFSRIWGVFTRKFVHTLGARLSLPLELTAVCPPAARRRPACLLSLALFKRNMLDRSANST